MMNGDVLKLYDNCLEFMKNTPEDWDKANDAFCKLYNKVNPEGQKELLERYDRLQKELEVRDHG